MDGLNGVEDILFYDAILMLLAIIAILSSLLVRKGKSVKLAEKRLVKALDGRISIRDFFDREIERTEKIISRAKQSRKNYHVKGLNLRRDILNFEKAYLVDEGASPSKLKEINFQLVNYLYNGANSDSNAEERMFANSDRELKSLGSNINKQKHTIRELKDRRVVREPLVSGLDKLAGEVDVVSLRSKMEDTRTAYRGCSNVIFSERRFALSESGGRDEKGQNNKLESYESEDLKDKIAEVKEKHCQSMKELERLVENNNQKRKIIMKLESEIFKMKGDVSDEAGGLIDKLKLQLKDSELCTATLEYEADSLRERLMGFGSGEIHDLQPEAGDGEVVDNDEGEGLISSDIFTTLLSEGFIRVVESASDLEVLNVLIDVFGRMKLQAVICSKGMEGKQWFSVEDKVADEVKEFVRSMVNKEKKTWVDGVLGTSYRGDAFTVCVENMYFRSSPEYLSLLSSLLVVAGGAINRLRIQQHSDKQTDFLTSLTSKAKASIDSIDEQNKYLSDEVKNIVDSFVGNLNEFVENVPMTDLQDDMFRDLEQEFKTRIELLFVVGGTMDDAFVELINLLDSRMQQ